MIWHYAVFTGQPFMNPACDILTSDKEFALNTHGITINRGHVNCSDCKRAMGMV